MPNEPTISASNGSKLNLPQGYTLVRKGNVYITKHCRKFTHEADRKVFIVQSATQAQLGIAVPQDIYFKVQKLDKETSANRATAVAKKDAVMKDAFEQELHRLYPHVPKDNVNLILKHTLQKRSGRVGRTTKLELSKIVTLAVRAHIRHKLTDYEASLRKGVDKEQARKEVQQTIDQTAGDWSGRVITSQARVEKSTVLKKEGRTLAVTTPTKRLRKTESLKRATLSPVKKLNHDNNTGNTSKANQMRRKRGLRMPHETVTSLSTDYQGQQSRRKSLRIEEQTFQAALSRLDDFELETM